MRRMARPDDSAADSVSALRRGFEVLQCIADAGKPLGNAEISKQTGIPRPSVTRLVATLVALGHVRPAAGSERFELAAGVVQLAQAFLGGLDVRGAARPHLVALAESTGASSLLGVRDGVEMLVIEAARSRSAVASLAADVGTRMALSTSALGRAWLAGVDDSTRGAVLAQLKRQKVANGPAIDAEFVATLAEFRAQGYALSLGDWHPAINAVSVPVRTPSGEVITINCGGPSFVMPADRLREVGIPAVLRTAEALARDIGGVAGVAVTHHQAQAQPG
jgi:IclR family transcriptional regulator, positive regulator for flagellar biogenesis